MEGGSTYQESISVVLDADHGNPIVDEDWRQYESFTCMCIKYGEIIERVSRLVPTYIAIAYSAGAQQLTLTHNMSSSCTYVAFASPLPWGNEEVMPVAVPRPRSSFDRFLYSLV